MEQPNIKKNYLYRMFYEVLVLLAPFITTPYVSRVLGADGVGIYSYTSSIMTYFTMFAALGTSSYGAREIAQHRDDKYSVSKLFYEIELMTIMTSFVCIVIWIGVILVSEDYKYYFLALLPLLFGTLFDISWLFTGLEMVKCIVIRNTVCKIVGIALLFVFVKDKNDLILYIAINSFVTLFGNLSMWTYLPSMLVKVDIKTLSFKRHFKETLIYFVPTIATSIYTVLDKTLIGLITRDNYANGYYEQASKVIKMVKTVVFVALNSVMGARISYLFAQKKYDEIHNRIERSMNFILLLGYGAVFGLLSVSERFVPVFFGNGYEPVVELLCLMSPLVIIIGVSNCLGSLYYTPSGKRKISARYIIIGSIVNLLMNLCMIPQWGAKGAVVASIIAESVISFLYMKNCANYMTAHLLMKYSWKRLIAGICMYTIVMFIGRHIFANDVVILFIQIIIGMATYFLFLKLLKDDMIIELIHMIKTILFRHIKLKK